LNQLSMTSAGAGASRLKLFWALSRTPHALIDMANPAAAALLCLGAFPSAWIIVLGLLTVFAGYTAVYALNDVVDYRTDQQKMRVGLYSDSESYLDGVLTRHPMAKGVLSFRQGILWAMAWALVALGGAYLLNAVCVVIFLAGCLLEAGYCLLWKVSPLRAAVNGIVKTLGAVAAVFAVDPHPSFMFLMVLSLWIFFWEIGGQNIPADWADIEEDQRFHAQTLPVRLGRVKAGIILMGCLIVSFFLNIVLFWVSPLNFGFGSFVALVLINVYLLLLPAKRLYETRDRADVMVLFNKASYLPLAVLILVVVVLTL
jgi:4-hydroxybenzoate polyprenyltransferase